MPRSPAQVRPAYCRAVLVLHSLQRPMRVRRCSSRASVGWQSRSRSPSGTASGGLAIRWEGFDAEPMPVHRLAGVDVAGADQELRVAIHTTTEALGDGGWVDAWARPPSLGRAGREWSLPTEMPGRVLGLITRAAGVLRIAESGLEHADGSTSALLAEQRRAALLSLRDSATHALEAATCAAAGYFAAQSRSTRS